jgi:GNAT superfamily N-acetyltransferase
MDIRRDMPSFWIPFDVGGRGLLEDLFVRQAFRSRGIGKALLAVARIAVEKRCYGIHWEVLDWNDKVIELYKQVEATFHAQWRPMLLIAEPLRRFAERAA